MHEYLEGIGGFATQARTGDLLAILAGSVVATVAAGAPCAIARRSIFNNADTKRAIDGIQELGIDLYRLNLRKQV